MRSLTNPILGNMSRIFRIHRLVGILVLEGRHGSESIDLGPDPAELTGTVKGLPSRVCGDNSIDVCPPATDRLMVARDD